MDQNLCKVSCVGVWYDWGVWMSYILHPGPEFILGKLCCVEYDWGKGGSDIL